MDPEHKMRLAKAIAMLPPGFAVIQRDSNTLWQVREVTLVGASIMVQLTDGRSTVNLAFTDFVTKLFTDGAAWRFTPAVVASATNLKINMGR